ncbi:hypothetical protein KAT80_02770 [Candidatus Pacearchaeota archaeon]|nr:hypothetical protein [Candidatus Pacearchaeota archaeon]
MINYWNKNRKNMDFWDIGLIKLCMVVLTLFVITIWSDAMNWVHSVNTWYFLIASIIIGARPFYRYYIK